MNLSKETLDVLKNFSTINKSLVVEEGSTLRVINATSSVMAEAKVKEKFPEDFAIYDMNVFLASYSNFTNPEIEFNGDHLIVKETEKGSKGSMKYFYTDPENLVKCPEKMPKLPSKDVEFELNDGVLSKIKKFYSTLQLSTANGASIIVEGNGKGTNIKVSEKKNKTSNDFGIQLDSKKSKSKFNFIFSGDNMNFLAGDYDVQISQKQISKFEHQERKLTYFVGLESDSTFSG